MQTTLLFILSLVLLSKADLQLTLSLGRIDIAAASIGTKAIFAGGLTAPELPGDAGIPTDRVDIYETTTGLWATANLSIARSSLLSLTVGTKVLFCGGAQQSNIVDIYNDVTGEWTTHLLSSEREFVKGTVVGTRAIFGGGKSLIGALLGITDIIEIYDSETDQWTTSLLLTARLSAAVTSVGNLALFIGGEDSDGGILGDIDIYDVEADVWVAANLSVVRSQLAAVSVGGLYAVIAGGLDLNDVISDVVEIYDGVAWTLATLPVARCQMQSATDGLRAFFIGGVTALLPEVEASARVDIYNPETGEWTLKLLAEARLNVAAINVGLSVFVAGGGNYSDMCEVFESEIVETPTPIVETPTPIVETPTPIVETPTPIVETPTPIVETPTPVETPVITPTPVPVPTPTDNRQCIIDCLTAFEETNSTFVEDTYFTDRCICWADYRQCLLDCQAEDEAEDLKQRCLGTPWVGELCECGDNEAPGSIRLIEILLNFKLIFLSHFNRLNGCSNAQWSSSLGVILQFQFSYETELTNMGQVSLDLQVLLGAFLNQNPERFIFGGGSSNSTKKRDVVDGAISVEVVEPPPPAGSATGITGSFVLLLVIALSHFF